MAAHFLTWSGACFYFRIRRFAGVVSEEKVMAKINVRVQAGGVALALLSVFGSAQAQWDGSLPALGDPNTSQVYQDFTIFSLNYLSNLRAVNPSYPGLTSPTYNVQSSPGQLLPELVAVTGNAGQVSNNLDTCGVLCDNAYDYPPPQATFFSSFAVADPNVAVPGEPTRSTWTATASALRTFLQGRDMVAMFNLNEDSGGAPNTLDGQALLVSARVQLTDQMGNVLYSFYLGANNALGLPQTARDVWESGALEPEADPTNTGAGNEAGGAEGNELYNPMLGTAPGNLGMFSADPRWAYVHGQIAVDTTTGLFLGFGTCVELALPNCTTINQNLGANEVAFSAFNQQLSDLINDPTNGVFFMNVDFVTAGQSNGFEQLFIVAADIPNRVPEPTALSLFGLGLLGAAVSRRRRK
jgi:hypothetical protein